MNTIPSEPSQTGVEPRSRFGGFAASDFTEAQFSLNRLRSVMVVVATLRTSHV